MYQRPWPIVILGLLHLLEPVGKLSLYSVRYGVAPWRILGAFGLWDGLIFFGAFPVAGIAILAIKRWSFPVFLIVQAFTVYDHFLSWSSRPDILPTVMFLGFNLLNLGVVSYFLIPAVRAPFFDPRLRWWESKPRYAVAMGVWVKRQGSSEGLEGVIKNISEGGVFLVYSEVLQMFEQVRTQWDFEGTRYELSGKVVHSAPIDKQPGYGIQFLAMTRAQRKQMRAFIQRLDAIGCPCLKPKVNLWEDFKTWFRLALHGKALIPGSRPPVAARLSAAPPPSSEPPPSSTPKDGTGPGSSASA